MSLRDPRLLAAILLIGAGIGAVVLLGRSKPEDATAPAVLDDEQVPTAQRDAALLHGRATAAPSIAAETKNPFADESELKTLLVAAANYKQQVAAWARIGELLGDDPARVNELIDLLRPGSTTADRYVASQCERIGKLLAELGRPGLAPLLDALEEDDPYFQMRVAACLAPFGARAKAAVPRLIDLMHGADEDPPAKITALYVDVLGRIGPASAKILPTLHRWLEEGETKEVEVAAARALVRVGGPTKEVFERAADVIAVGSWQSQRAAVAQEIGGLGRRAEPMLPELLRLSRDGEDGSVQGTAVNLIGLIGVPDPDVIAQLEKDLTETTDLRAFTGPWAFALSKLGSEGHAALLRAVEAKAPLSAGYAARHLRASGLSSARIWALLEPGIVLGDTPEEERVDMVAALNRFFESECEVPAAAATRLMPLFARYADDGWARRSGLGFAYHVDRPTHAWCEMLQVLLRDSDISKHDPYFRERVAGVLTRTAIADKAKTLEGIRLLIAEDPSDISSFHLLLPFVSSHPQPVLSTWRLGVEKGAVDWHYLRRLLTKGTPPKLVAPKSVADEIHKHTDPR